MATDDFFDSLEPQKDAWEEEHFSYYDSDSDSDSEEYGPTIEDMILGYLEEFRAKHNPRTKALAPILDIIGDRDWFDGDQENAVLISAFVVAFLMEKTAEGLTLDARWLAAVTAKCISEDKKARDEAN